MASKTGTRLRQSSAQTSSRKAHGRDTAVKTVALAGVVFTLGGCVMNAPKNLIDYLNLRNSFLTPSEVGRFDKEYPWGTVKPVTWPILDQLDVVDEPQAHWTTATDPLPGDLVVDTSEYTVGEGDELIVSVFELVTPGLEWARQLSVNELGDINLQNLGRLHVAGLTPSEIEERIGQSAVDKKLLLPRGEGNPGPQVSVSLVQSRARIFLMLGSVQQTGVYPIIRQDFRLMDALAASRDVLGGMQPGMDYLYVIRPAKGAGVVPPTRPSPKAPAVPTAPGRNPLETLEGIERGTPGTTTAPKAPEATGPTLIRSITAVAMPSPQGDLERALLIPPGTAPATVPAAAPGVAATEPAPATTQGGFIFVDGRWVPANGSTAPATAAAAAPTVSATEPAAPTTAVTVTTAPPAAMTMAATQPATVPAMAIAPATQTAPLPGPATQGLLEQGVGATAPGAGTFMFVDGKWVPVNPPGTQAAAPGGGLSPSEMAAAASGLEGPRVIRISLDGLKEGNPKYNIIIRPGDIINVPNIMPGEFYILGHVNRPGVYALTGRKVTLKQAIAAAGNLDAVAIPRRCDLIRRIGNNQEVIVQVNLQAIFDGDQPDIFLKSNDTVNIGTDAVAPWLAVMRNAYRFSYGFGFVYDRNFYIQPTAVAK